MPQAPWLLALGRSFRLCLPATFKWCHVSLKRSIFQALGGANGCTTPLSCLTRVCFTRKPAFVELTVSVKLRTRP